MTTEKKSHLSDLQTNRVHDLYLWFKEGLTIPCDQNERNAITNEVFFRLLDISPEQRIINHERRLPESGIMKLSKALDRLNGGEPVQYITGVTDFLDQAIHVKPGVLIPRPETEELAIWLQQHIRERAGDPPVPMRILDVGTGSGCIAIALAAGLPDHEVLACDMDEKILQVAKHNAKINNQNIGFFQCDIVDDSKHSKILSGSLDVVVSNPPYVRESEKTAMKDHILFYEPGKALFVPDHDPLLFYRAITKQSWQWLKPGGWIFYEINEAMGQSLHEMMNDLGFQEIRIKQDIHDKDRFLCARKPI